MRARGLAYDRGWLDAVDVGVPVLSIGNITAGGTGKTPLTSFLLQSFSSQGRRVGVVSRGYGGSEQGPARVPADGLPRTAARFGDEPAWLAARHPDVPVVIGADRVAAAKHLGGAVDLILADDAFQHRRLRRGFDAVVIDATEPIWHYRSLPLGRQREDFRSLARARAVFLTKTNLAEREALTWLRSRLADVVPPTAAVFEFEARLAGVVPLGAPVVEPARELALTGAVLLVSGIGRPQTFRKSVETDLRAEVAEQMIFPDHYRYGDEDRLRIRARAEELGVSAIVMTEKDAVKMSGPADFRLPAWVTRLETRPLTPLKEFYEAVDRFLF